MMSCSMMHQPHMMSIQLSMSFIFMFILLIGILIGVTYSRIHLQKKSSLTKQQVSSDDTWTDF